MTYITYGTEQWQISNLYGIINNSTSTKHTLKVRNSAKILPKPQFFPSYLVRVSDMIVVRGSEVKEGYCALSYCWNKSGDLVQKEYTGRSMIMDEVRHQIVFPGEMTPKTQGAADASLPIPSSANLRDLFNRYAMTLASGISGSFDLICAVQRDRNEKQREI